MTDHDRLYKELLRTFFKEFMELFFAEAAEWIDFTHVEFLSEEVVVDLTGGTKKRLDLLVKTRLKGDEAYILVHQEPQAYYEQEYPERMFIYSARLYEKHRLPVLPIAVLSHNRQVEEPDHFGWSLPFLNVLQFRYYRLQLRKYNWRDFIESDNPVAAALLSSMKYNEDEKIQMKLEFVRMMTRMQLDPAKMELLMVFFETYLPLKEEEERQVWKEIEQIYGERREAVMEWKTSFEKLAEKRGKEEGIKEGIREGEKKGKEEVAAKLLNLGLDSDMIEAATGLTAAELAALKENGDEAASREV
ncbi:MAG: transposase [Paenibacillaceae bacterium]|nr:transposase [Paenibacillaceae bacterium]